MGAEFWRSVDDQSSRFVGVVQRLADSGPFQAQSFTQRRSRVVGYGNLEGFRQQFLDELLLYRSKPSAG